MELENETFILMFTQAWKGFVKGHLVGVLGETSAPVVATLAQSPPHFLFLLSGLPP